MNITQNKVLEFVLGRPWLGLALALGALAHFSILDQWKPYHLWLVVAGGVLLAVCAWWNRASLGEFLKTRQALHGMNFVVSIVILLVVLGLANFLAVRYNQKWDSTPEKLYSLSDQTVKLLKGLQKPVKLLLFSRGPNDQATDLLKEYSSHSPQLKWQLVDADRSPDQARKYGVRAYNTLVVDYNGRFELVETVEESKLTSAIIKATRDKIKKVCFVEGHGEKSITDADKAGYTAAAEALKGSNYQVETVNLIERKGVPDDCGVLVIAGPQKELFDQEVVWIHEYSGKGGALLVMVDPMAGKLVPLLSRWGLAVRDDLVLDASQLNEILGTGPGVTLLTQYPGHDITKSLRGMSFFPLACSLEEISPAPEGITLQKLLATSEASWGETDFEKLDQTGEAGFDESKEKQGPLTIGFTGERSLPAGKDGQDAAPRRARLAVIGDSEFAANAYFGAQMNGDVFLNTVNWLSLDEDLISIRPKSPTDRRIMLTEAHKVMTFYSSFVLLPLIPLVLGVVVVIVRRRKR